MKTLFLTVLMLIGMMGMAQEAKLSSVYTIEVETGDTTFSTYYVYDVDGNLEYTDLFYVSGSHLQRKYYRNDSIIKTGVPYGDEYWFHYYNDSIVVPFGWDTTMATVYHLDDYGLIIRENLPGNGTLYEWENGNMIEEVGDGESNYTATYNDDYLNPLYEEYKYFRLKRDGSYNYIKEWGPDLVGNYREYTVVESIGQYPTKTEEYLNGELYNYHHYYYYDIVSGIPEVQSEPHIILTVDYYDLMGRKISKPSQGLYIMRKTTDKGVISTTHYIR